MVHRFIGERDEEKMLKSTGSALLGSALTTVAVFGLLSFSFLPPLRMFGMAVSLAISYALIAAIFILPAIMYWLRSSEFLK
jgi:predicted RND superfamily exporter protein